MLIGDVKMPLLNITGFRVSSHLSLFRRHFFAKFPAGFRLQNCLQAPSGSLTERLNVKRVAQRWEGFPRDSKKTDRAGHEAKCYQLIRTARQRRKSVLQRKRMEQSFHCSERLQRRLQCHQNAAHMFLCFPLCVCSPKWDTIVRGFLATQGKDQMGNYSELLAAMGYSIHQHRYTVIIHERKWRSCAFRLISRTHQERLYPLSHLCSANNRLGTRQKVQVVLWESGITQEYSFAAANDVLTGRAVSVSMWKFDLPVTFIADENGWGTLLASGQRLGIMHKILSLMQTRYNSPLYVKGGDGSGHFLPINTDWNHDNMALMYFAGNRLRIQKVWSLCLSKCLCEIICESSLAEFDDIYSDDS